MDDFATCNRPVLDNGELVLGLAVRPRIPMPLTAFDEQLAQKFAFFNERPAGLSDVSALREVHPGPMTLGTWLRGTGRKP
ncbi:MULTISPECIES: hypothetical protein [Streptomyces]|uniref:Uncharacterized protein n=1 Tax=Streptomyces sp. NBC_00093 TaxID=2975649 RepID=A0AAU2AEJ3_9ACTN